MNSKIELIGWIAGVCLAICGAPESYNAITTGDSALSWMFLSSWGCGEVLALVYALLKSKKVKLLPLMFNYGLNISFIATIMICKGF